MPHIPRAICGGCYCEMKCIRTGINVEMVMEDGSSYYKIMADQFGCPHCENTVLTGFADRPFAQHFEENYKDYVVDLRADFAG